jgi:hypothetical protein
MTPLDSRAMQKLWRNLVVIIYYQNIVLVQADWYYDVCHYDECHYEECHYEECHYEECHYEECHYEECHYEECHYEVSL